MFHPNYQVYKNYRKSKEVHNLWYQPAQVLNNIAKVLNQIAQVLNQIVPSLKVIVIFFSLMKTSIENISLKIIINYVYNGDNLILIGKIRHLLM